MKNLKSISIIFLAFFTLVSCNKDREEEPENSYTNADSFYEDNKEEEQEYIIRTDTGGCIEANKGTIICANRSALRTASNDTVGLPYSVLVVELYSIKDHLLYNFPTAASGIALKNGGTVRIKAVKDGSETSIVTPGGVTTTYSVDPATTGNSAFKGTMPDDVFSDWETASEGSTLALAGTKDKLTMSSFGWFQSAQNSYGSSTTTVSFELEGTGGESLDLWLVQSGNKTLLHGTDLKIENVPVGQSMTAIVIAVDQDGKLVLHESTFTVSANDDVTIDFDEIDEDDLLDKLEAY